MYLGGNVGLGLLHVVRPEQKLSVQVRFFDQVHVGDHYVTVSNPQTHHGKVFKQFTTNRARANYEVFLTACKCNKTNRVNKSLLTVLKFDVCFF